MITHPTRADAVEAASAIIDSLRKDDGEFISETERIQILHKAKELAMLLEKPEDGLIKLVFAPSQVMSMRVCVDLGIFPILSEKPETSAEELSARTGADETLIRRLLRILTATSLVVERGVGLYGPNKWTEKLATRTTAAMIKWNCDLSLHCLGHAAAWFKEAGYKNPQDPKAVPFQRAFNAGGVDIYPWLTMPENEQYWNNANEFFEGDRGSRPSWVTWFPVREKLFSGLKVEEGGPLLVDVAGGRGHDISEFEKQFPDVSGRLVLQDQQFVLDSAISLSTRVEKHVIDFWKDVPVRDSRIYFMKFIMHDFNDEQCVQILKNIAGAMKKGYSQLVINDFILPDANCPELSAQWDLIMMSVMAGVERTESQWVSLLDLAGLHIEGLYQPPGDGQGIIVATLA